MTGLFLGRATLGALALSIATGGPAAAQAICGKRDAIVAKLEQKYGETRRSFGLQQGRGLVEIWASERTGSWTILVTRTNGQTCLIAAGEAFESEAAAQEQTPI
jgi:hypothetical protein